MTTDLDKTIDLLDSFGVFYNICSKKEENDWITTLVLTTKKDKVIGYRDFFSEYTFINGKFKDIGIWE